jgi:hypothetical protein
MIQATLAVQPFRKVYRTTDAMTSHDTRRKAVLPTGLIVSGIFRSSC